MIEDRLLKWKFKHGSGEALRRIYEKYVSYLLTLATALLNDANIAEDVVHEVFVSFAQSAEKLKLEGSLKSYLATCVANRARNEIRSRERRPGVLNDENQVFSDLNRPEISAITKERVQTLRLAMARLSYEQREVIMLHLQGGMMFTQIARLQKASVNTVKSRYRYGLDKLRLLLNSEII